MEQKRLRCATTPMARPAASETHSSARLPPGCGDALATDSAEATTAPSSATIEPSSASVAPSGLSTWSGSPSCLRNTAGGLSPVANAPALVCVAKSGLVPSVLTTTRTRSTTAKVGRIHPRGLATALARPRLKPFLRKTMPTSTPATMPRMPQMAVRSPPPRRSQARTVQPRKISAPAMKMKPSTNRTTGWLPPRGRNSRVRSAAPIAPRMMPMISGLM